MICVPPKVLIHKLGVDPNFLLVRQKKHPNTPIWNRFVKDEVIEFLNIGSVLKVTYSN